MTFKTQLLLLFLLASSISFAKTIYVATNGNDNNNGTINAPYKTFNKAVSVMSAGDICIIRGGTYENELIINKSGNASNFLTFKAADGEDVKVKATSFVNGWQQHSGNIYKANVSMSIASRFRTVYHNNEYMDLARWPNNTDKNRWTVNCTPVTGGNGSHFTVSSMPDIDWTGGLVYYLGAHSGASWTRTITSNTATQINFTNVDITKWPFSTHNPTTWRNYPGNQRGQLYLFNKLEALDYAREWYYESSSNTLYLQTENGNKPEDNSVEYATRKYAAELNGDYIKLEGIEFFGGAIKIHNRADYNQIINCTVTHGSEGHDSLTNTGAQVGEASIEVLGDFTLIKGCTINHSSVSGIVISGWAADDCIVEENTISNTDYVGIHASPIRTSGDRMKVLKNTIFNTGRDGMYVAGTNCEVAYNDVSHSQIINSDSGVFYTVGNDNPKNNEIHHNWFHDATAPSYSHNPSSPAKAAGIYLDNDSKGYSVHHNVVWNISWTGYQVNWNNVDLNFYHNTIWNAWGAMDSWDINGPQLNNKIYNNYANTGSWFTKTNTDFDIKNSPIFSDSPFENASEQNFMPKAGSSLIDTAPIISGFSKIYKGASPDIGAYERGGTRWTAGVNAIEDTGNDDTWTIFDTQFTINSTSETCPDENNGTAFITADISGNYKVEFNNTSRSFTKETTFTNLSPGTYPLCISNQGETDRQCYEIVINSSENIIATSSLSATLLNLEIEKGTPPFSVYINGNETLNTSSKNIQTKVHNGDIVEVKSHEACEGSIIKTIDFNENIIATPNPTTGIFYIQTSISNGNIPVKIYNTQSLLIKSNTYKINNGTILINLENQSPGVYFVKIFNENSKVLKVIKK
ncbi:T9SS type A sorting domain-containing protein [Wenyingzhuangia sp. IMCC45574]